MNPWEKRGYSSHERDIIQMTKISFRLLWNMSIVFQSNKIWILRTMHVFSYVVEQLVVFLYVLTLLTEQFFIYLFIFAQGTIWKTQTVYVQHFPHQNYIFLD